MSAALCEELRDVEVSPVVSFDLSRPHAAWIDLSGKNPLFNTVDLRDNSALTEIVSGELAQAGASIGLGGYNEDRVWYQRSALFSGEEEPRTVHLGVDIWCPPGSAVSAPLAGTVHSFQDNNNFGDYGPTVILEHQIQSGIFFTLYGHLSRTSLQGLSVGKSLASGECFAEIGDHAENGEWPPHLHFQIMLSLDGKSGDYPGVCARRMRERYVANCPDPNLILRSEVLWYSQSGNQ